jgi:hypothetical protein
MQLVEGMLGTLATAGGIGFLLGLRYQVPAVLLASMPVAVAAVAAAVLKGASALGVLASSVGAVAVLQCGYVGGLLVAYAVSRAWQRRGGGSGP